MMERILAIQALAALLACVAAWHWVMYRRSRGRTWSPLWGAFTATAVAMLFLVAGTLGYRLRGGVPFTIAGAWSGTVVWSEIWVGVAVALIAIYLWRRGLRSLRRSP
jgi:hypothetical protein